MNSEKIVCTTFFMFIAYCSWLHFYKTLLHGSLRYEERFTDIEVALHCSTRSVYLLGGFVLVSF